MKKLILILFVAVSFSAVAQVNPHAIGLRMGGGSVFGGEASYQHGLGDAHRIELDAGIGTNLYHTRLYLVGIYHWNWNIVAGLNWYIGPGASVGLYTYDGYDGYLNVGVGGQVGFEYDFNTLNVPLLASIDARPMWDLMNGYGDYTHLLFGTALSVRYTF